VLWWEKRLKIANDFVIPTKEAVSQFRNISVDPVGLSFASPFFKVLHGNEYPGMGFCPEGAAYNSPG
jgi:hypothetical protein